MIVTCMFVVWYSVHGLSRQYTQPFGSCKECAALVTAYLEAGPPKWYEGDIVVPMCIRREEEANPA